MRTCFITCTNEAYKLDEAMNKHFTNTAGNMVNGEVVNIELYTHIIHNNYTICGKCHNKMTLKQRPTDITAAETPKNNRYLYDNVYNIFHKIITYTIYP